MATHQKLSLPADLAERDLVIRVGVIYFIAVAVPAFGLSAFALLYAPVGLLRDRAGRGVHLGQLVAALAMLTATSW